MARTVLSSGLRIVTEEERSVRSAAFGIWVNVGSRDESLSTAGASHFLEHLLFKGTKTRSSLEISSAIEAVGGETNAFTSKEYTCFYARVIDKEKESMQKWNLTALTYMHTNDWVKLFKEVGYNGDYYWFIAE